MARFRNSLNSVMLALHRRSRAGLLLTTALQAAALVVVATQARAQPATNARPTGGSVVAGQATIATAPAM